METRQSMLEEPSKGSKQTMYLPWKEEGRVAKRNFTSSAKLASEELSGEPTKATNPILFCKLNQLYEIKSHEKRCDLAKLEVLVSQINECSFLK